MYDFHFLHKAPGLKAAETGSAHSYPRVHTRPAELRENETPRVVLLKASNRRGVELQGIMKSDSGGESSTDQSLKRNDALFLYLI